MSPLIVRIRSGAVYVLRVNRGGLIAYMRIPMMVMHGRFATRAELREAVREGAERLHRQRL